MSLQFSEATNNSGICQQARFMAGVDSTQWPTSRIVNSCNNYLDFIAGYAIAADKRFQWDDTNHTKLPEGTTSIIANQSDYSFLTDEQGNNILTLLRIDSTDSGGVVRKLIKWDAAQTDLALSVLFATTGIPQYYDLIADNIIRLYPTPSASVTNGLKFFFQRTPSYFATTDTTKAPGVAPLLHRGFVIFSAYDCALSLGLPNLNALAAEKVKEEQKLTQYFADRNQDEKKVMRPRRFNFRGSL